MKVTVWFNGSLWEATFERIDDEGYSVARWIFGGEPSEPEFYQFVLFHFSHLKFGAPLQVQPEERKVNPKRAQKEARREMERLKENSRPSTFAQTYMKEELEKHKKEKKQISKEEKEARIEEQFLLRQKKKKEKHRGH